MRVVLADRRRKVRYALRVLLQEHGDVEVAGEVTDRGEMLAQIEVCRPDVLVVDWDLCALEAAALMRSARQVCPGTRVVVMCGRPGLRAAALAAGADAFVSKGDPPEALVTAIRAL